MSWRTNKTVLLARNVGRTLGLNRRIAMWMNGSGYEARYDERLSQALSVGDVVWDVGANVGYYTQIFSRRVGAVGKVIAFEPSPLNFERLFAATQDASNIVRVSAALGRENGTLAFDQGEDDLGATSRINHEGKGDILVEVKRGADLIASGVAPVPTAIKIDVEGFELEVLQG